MSAWDIFKIAQDEVYANVISELKNGKKESHWMWFIFPQIAGLGSSSMSLRYAIPNLESAKMYLKDQTMGSRLEDCTELVLSQKNMPLADIFGEIDSLKFRSSMTLFDLARKDSIFNEALNSCCKETRCERTLSIVGNNVGNKRKMI